MCFDVVSYNSFHVTYNSLYKTQKKKVLKSFKSRVIRKRFYHLMASDRRCSIVVCMYIVTFFNVCYQISMIMYWEQEVTTQVCMNLSVCNNQHGHFSSPKCGKISNLSTSFDFEHIWYGFLFTFCRISNLSPKHCRKLSEFVSKIKEESQVLQSPE